MVRLTLTRLVVFFLVLSLVTLPATVSQAQNNTTSNDVRYFHETGHSMKGMFRVFWEANGGVETFGYPITEEYADPTTGHTVQYFERARFELKDRNGEPYVDLGKLGLEILEGRTFPQAQPIFDTAQRRYIDEAGYIIQYGFKEIWEKRGGERIFGLPVSNEVEEWVPDGSLRTVQYFEQARFEYWPEFAPGRRVLLTHLGRRLAPRTYLEQIPPPGSTSSAAQSSHTYPESAVSSGTKVGNPTGAKAPDTNTQSNPPAMQAPDTHTQSSPPAMQAPADTGTQQPSYNQAPYVQPAPADYVYHTDAPRASSMFLLPDAFTNSSNEVFRPSPPLVLLGPEDSTTIKPMHTDNSALPQSFHAFVKPKIGIPGSSFALEAHGFEGGEIVGIWLSGPNEENFDVQMNVKADKDGVIGRHGLLNVGTKRDFFEGVWAINAQGVDSGRHAVGYFRLSRSVDPSVLPAPAYIPFPVFLPEPAPQPAQVTQPSQPAQPSQPVQPDTNGASTGPSYTTPEDLATSGKLLQDALPATGTSLVMPLAGPSGTKFVLLAQGYMQDEKVEAWVTTPDKKRIPIDAAQVQVDSNGSAQVHIASDGFQDGIYVGVAKGAKSGTVNSASFMITSAYMTDPTTPRPVNIHGSATPSQGGMGTVFELRGYGLQPDEALESWITDPTGAYTFLPEAVYADAQGRVGYQPVLNIVANHELVLGVYGFHFRGKSSGRQVSIYFTYFE